MLACRNGQRETASASSENSRVDFVCKWKKTVDKLCRRLGEIVVKDEGEEGH